MLALTCLAAALQGAGTWERQLPPVPPSVLNEAAFGSEGVGIVAFTDKVAVLRQPPGLVAVSLADGKDAWTVPHTGEVVRLGKTLVLKGRSTRDPARGLDLATGEAAPIPLPKGAELTLSGSSVYFALDQRLQRADLNGQVAWEWKAPSRRLRPVPHEYKEVVLVPTDEALVGLDHDGKELWTLPHPAGQGKERDVRHSPHRTDAGIVVERGLNTLEVIDPRSGKILRSASHKDAGGIFRASASGDSIAWITTVEKKSGHQFESSSRGMVFNAASGRFSQVPVHTDRLVAVGGSYAVFKGGSIRDKTSSLFGLDGKGGSWSAPQDSLIPYGTTDGHLGRLVLDGKALALEIRHASGAVVGKAPVGNAAWTGELFKGAFGGGGTSRHLAFKPCGDLFLLHVDDELRIVDTKARLLKKLPFPRTSGDLAWGARVHRTALVQLSTGKLLGIGL